MLFFWDKMLLFWMKCYNFGSNATVDQFRIWLMGYGPILIWPIEAMGHGPNENMTHFCTLLRKSVRATCQAALPIPTRMMGYTCYIFIINS